MGPRSSVLAGLLLVSCSASSQTVSPGLAPGRYVLKLSHQGLERSYILRVPKQSVGPSMPVVVVLHGYTGNAAAAESYTGMGAAVEKAGWIGVFPDGTGNPRAWNASFLDLTGRKVDDVSFIGALLDDVEKKVRVDKDRVFVAGHSNGAMMAHTLAARMSDRIAAIGAVAGVIGMGPNTMIPPPKGPVSVMMIHGKKDNVVAYDRAAQALLHGVPVPDGAAIWAKRLQAASVPIRRESDGGVETKTWAMGNGGAEVVLVSIRDAQHEWPTGKVDAASLLIDFFRNHPKRR